MEEKASPIRSQIASRLHSVAVHLLRRARPADRESGLSAARLSALSVVVFGGPVGLRELAEAEQVTAPTMSRLVSGLEEDGLIRRRPDPVDGRGIRITATPKGRRLMEQGRARRVQRLAAILEGLSEAELATLSRAAAVLERALEAGTGAGRERIDTEGGSGR